MPEVSVIIPAYNYADYTVQAVDSVLAQTFKDFELIVVDDGSTDGTGEALKRFGDRIKYVYKQNGGVSSARNLGVRLAKGKYIAFLDCDDLWLPNKLAETLKGFADGRVGLVYTDGLLIDANGCELPGQGAAGFSGHVYERLLISNFINNPTVMVLKSCFEQVGFFDESLFFAADWDMWLRLAEKYEVAYVAQALSKYRIVRDYRLTNAAEAEGDSLMVLKKAWSRNPALSQRLKRKALSAIYSDMVLVHKRRGDYPALCRATLSLAFVDPGEIFSFLGIYLRKDRALTK
jgi:glycosyltransferase involved in cell wall biosynthesis